MNILKILALCGIIILPIALVLGACAPELDEVAPTEAILIKNIPVEIFRTAKDATDDEKKQTFKVYVQLSAGMTASAGYSAMGEARSVTRSSSGKFFSLTVTDLKGPDGETWRGTNWINLAVVISPEYVLDIFDIDVKAGIAGPSLNPVVTVDWRKLMAKTGMNLAGDGITNFKRLYGMEGHSDGVVVNDNEIKYTLNNSERPPRAGTEISSFSQFTSKNDYQQ